MFALATATAAHESLSPRPYRVLVCDDQADVCHALQLLLKGAGYQTVAVDSPRALLKAAVSSDFDLILADLNYARDTTSGEEGMDLLSALRAQGNTTPVVVMTAWGSIDLAVQAMQQGARDFIQKPWDNARVLEVIGKQAELGRRPPLSAKDRAVRASRAFEFESERDESELAIAAKVQQKMFPGAAHSIANLDYAGHCMPAHGIGGDYYDFLNASLTDADAGDCLSFVLADVAGKGIPAALLMANLQACFRSQSAENLHHPARMLETVNRQFHASTTTDRFATVFFGTYTSATRILHYANCGHNPPMLLRESGEMETLEATATMLGAFEKWGCSEAVVELLPGDTLLLYSDGVTEAVSESGEEFGEVRLRQMLRDSPTGTAADLVERIASVVTAFSGGSRTDDATLVAIRAI